MGYVDRNLMAGEEILLRPRYHPVRFLPGAIGIALGLLVALGSVVLPQGSASPGVLVAVGGALAVIGLLAVVSRAIIDSFDEFAITPLRIIKKTGFLTRRVSQIPLDKVQDLHLVATLWGRWLSYGNVEVESAANDGPVVFRRIQNPEAFRNVVFTRRAAPAAASVAPTTQLRTAEARLADVERLFKTGSLTEGEYKLKRQELVKQL